MCAVKKFINKFNEKEYGNYVVDSAAKFSIMKITQLIQLLVHNLLPFFDYVADSAT